MDNIKVLIVEDDKTQNDVLANFLRKESYNVISAYSLHQARNVFDNSFHIVILDVILPDGNGLDYLKEIRTNNNVPVIILTALDDEYTQISTFELKADEYVDKPCSPLIMTKRVKALINRVYGECNKLIVNDFHFDFNKFIVTDKNDQDIKMTTKEISIVKFLYENKGCVVSREAVIQNVWGYDYIYADRAIDTHIKNIRKKTDPSIIITVKGIGYRLNI